MTIAYAREELVNESRISFRCETQAARLFSSCWLMSGMWKGGLDRTVHSMAGVRSEFEYYFGGGRATSKPGGSYFIGD